MRTADWRVGNAGGMKAMQYPVDGTETILAKRQSQCAVMTVEAGMQVRLEEFSCWG
jgi:hypothetical protein